MKLPLPAPRLLPVTIAAMALVLGTRSVVLVRAAAPEAMPAAQPAPAPAEPLAPPPPPPPTPPPAPPPISAGERALLFDLRRRSDQLDARAAAVQQREAVLEAAEARLKARLDQLAGLQQRLEALDGARRERDEANWRGLVKLYESMKPADAGAIFNDLDLPVLLPILDRMKAAKAAAILAAMQPERARLATSELAQLRTRANAVPPPGKPAAGG